MKKALILATGWAPDYWESDKEAPYPKTKYTELDEWDDLFKNCPLPGIGRYIKQKDRDLSTERFVYLKVSGMRYDPNTQEPYFSVKFLKKSNTESSKLENGLPYNKRRFFSAMESEELIKILKNIGEEPPEEWKKLTEIKEEITHWKDYLGKYFLEMEEKSLSNDEFEDRVAALLVALGFEVDPKGHKVPGEYPDGIFSFDDYAIVYDCKNTQNFAPSAEDERAIRKYLDDEQKIRSEKNILCAFIAKGFKEEGKKDIFYLSITSLLYLLYKRLRLGSRFNLSPLKKILDNSFRLTMEIIDKEWIE